MKYSWFVVAVLVALLGFSFPAEACKKQFFKEPKVEVRINEDCRVDVFPKREGRRDRNYTFYPEGRFMVFVDTEDYDTNSKATGSRTFEIFPAVSGVQPQVAKNSSGRFEIVTAGGAHVTLNDFGEIDSINGGKVVTSEIKHIDTLAKEKGGIEISGAKGVVVDYGWSKGGLAYRRLGNSSLISDERGHGCSVKNSEMWAPNPKDQSDPLPKLESNDEWRAFVQKRCKNLKWTDEPYKTVLEKAMDGNDPLGDFLDKLKARGEGAQ